MTSAAEIAFALVDVGRDAAAVVAHRAGAVGIERHGDFGGVAGQRLVDRVVDDLVDHVVQAGAVVGVADVHARPLAHRIEALEDLDRLGVVVGSAVILRAGSAMQLPRIESENLRENQRLIWHEKRCAVQRKVDRANMLIRWRFLKVRRVKNGSGNRGAPKRVLGA